MPRYSSPCKHHGFQEQHQTACKGHSEGQRLQWVHWGLKWLWSPRCHWSRWSPGQNTLAPQCHQSWGLLPPIWNNTTREDGRAQTLVVGHAQELRNSCATVLKRSSNKWKDLNGCNKHWLKFLTLIGRCLSKLEVSSAILLTYGELLSSLAIGLFFTI